MPREQAPHPLPTFRRRRRRRRRLRHLLTNNVRPLRRIGRIPRLDVISREPLVSRWISDVAIVRRLLGVAARVTLLATDQDPAEEQAGGEEEQHEGGPGEGECVAADAGAAAVALEAVAGFHEYGAGREVSCCWRMEDWSEGNSPHQAGGQA